MTASEDGWIVDEGRVRRAAAERLDADGAAAGAQVEKARARIAGPMMLKSASRSIDGLGRTACPATVRMNRPRHSPAVMRRLKAGPFQRPVSSQRPSAAPSRA